ncbi:hypothetical protein [Sphingomonas koreensis]
MPDLLVAVEKAALAHLKADAAFVAVIPAAQILTSDGSAVPPKPFVKPGTAIVSPYTGHRKRRAIRFPLYIRADARKSGTGAVLELARDHMGRCVDALCDSLYRARLPVSGGTARFELINDIRRKVDGEADALEANIEFRVVVMAA